MRAPSSNEGRCDSALTECVLTYVCEAAFGSSMGPEGAAKVAAGLEKNTTLTSINLYGALCTPAEAAAGATPRTRVCDAAVAGRAGASGERWWRVA